MTDIDALVRLAAFQFLDEQTRLHGDVVSRALLAQGFVFRGVRVPLVGPQGIFKPAVLPEIPLSITTVPVVEGRARPYDDEIGPDGFLLYRYRGTNPDHPDNVGLRMAMYREKPLIYLFGLVPGEYLPVRPVYVVRDDPVGLMFTVAVDDEQVALLSAPPAEGVVAEVRRRYVTSLVRRRLHQQSFRARVFRAYQERCTVCRLRHRELLEAAHILPDRDPRGEPLITNGLALCKLHHAAFDRHLLGIRPDLTVQIRLDILEEADGPMLRHGLQGFNGASIVVPHRPELRPRPEFLEERFALFRRAP